MDDSYLPSKRTLNPFFSPGSYGSSDSSPEKLTIKKQKLLSAFANTTTTTPSSLASTTSAASSSIETNLAVESKQKASTTTKSQKSKLYHIFEPQPSKPHQDVSKCPPRSPSPPPLDQMEQQLQQRSSRDVSPVTTITITKSLSNIHVSDPDCIPTPTKASEWTTPSRSSTRPLAPKEIDYDNDPSSMSQKDSDKKRGAPWPDDMTFMGGHIKQCYDQKASHEACMLQCRPRNSSCQLQQIVKEYGGAYLKGLGQKRLTDSMARQPTINHTASPTVLSKLRILSPSSSTTQSQHASFSVKHEQLPYDIVETMDALYPPDGHGGGWRYPACEDLLNRYNGGELEMTTESTVNWCDKYRPKQVEYLLDNQSHHCYIRDWLERHKVAPSKTDPSFFAARKKVTRRAMEQHYDDTDETNDGDDDDFMLPGEASLKKKKKSTKKRKKDLNMILLVGPHGVGKTTGVFTAAQETGYQVFEIHPGLRRSLKDVMRLVGDMTKNHLVRFNGIKSFLGQQQHQENGTSRGSGLANDHDDDESDESGNEDDGDMKSRKESSTSKPNQLLTHFFTPKLSTGSSNKSKSGEKTATATNTDHDLAQSTIPTNQRQLPFTSKPSTSPSGPKQSLILLEEVDILYQSDKGFWNAVTDLARTSKRPIILTCNDTSVIPFDILQLQAVVHYEPPLRQLTLPFLHLICLMEGYLVPTTELVALVEKIGLDIRQLLTTLEYLHYCQRTTSLRDDQQQSDPPKLNNAMLQAHMNLLLNQADIHALQKSWYHLSDNIPGNQMPLLCTQLAQNGLTNNQSELDTADEDEDLLPSLQTWLNNRSLIDYGIGMTENRISQVYGLDEHGCKDDQESGYLRSWKKHDDLDHYEMEAYMESSLLELNQPQHGTGLVDIMSWEVISAKRNMQYEDDLLLVEHMVHCRSSMAMGSIGTLDIPYSKHIEHLRRIISRKRRRRPRRVPF